MQVSQPGNATQIDLSAPECERLTRALTLAMRSEDSTDEDHLFCGLLRAKLNVHLDTLCRETCYVRQLPEL
jgi:hypothetical protein